MCSMIATLPDGTEAGRASVARELHGQPCKPGQVFLTVAVEPAYRRRGFGGELYQAAVRQAAAMGATSLACSVAAGDADSLAFATRRGFRRDYEMMESTLDLTRFDMTPYAGAVAACEARGICFTTLLQQQDDLRVLKNLYELDEAISYDIPDWSGIMPPFDEFVTGLQECAAEAVIMAWDGDRLVGYSATSLEADGTAYTSILGVLPSHRGRGIALALKLLTFQWALRQGCATILTHNNAANTAIVDLNRKLGYKVIPSQTYLVREASIPEE